VVDAFGSALSTAPDAATAAREACASVARDLAGAAADLAVVFATPGLMANAAGIAAIIDAELGPGALIGCTAEGVIGTGRELERPPGLSLWAAALPGGAVEAFAIDPSTEPLPGGDGTTVVLADPFSFPPGVLRGADGRPMAGAIVGGMASGGREPGDHRLVMGDTVRAAGAVGVHVPGARVLVSQGCRPVGPEMTITAVAGDGVIAELAGRPALQRVREVVEGLPADERALVEQGVLAGLVVDGNKPQLEQGDFLIRGIAGGDPSTGALLVGEDVRVGQVMRLQVRDHASAHADLHRALSEVPAGTAQGALLFACNGRGTRMFPDPHHDARALDDALGHVPVAGLFCNGEIGPVGGRAYLHGFTATMAVFTSA
jgi:small ligand-binding sensory domain FIST